jgi:hypothetical protein
MFYVYAIFNILENRSNCTKDKNCIFKDYKKTKKILWLKIIIFVLKSLVSVVYFVSNYTNVFQNTILGNFSFLKYEVILFALMILFMITNNYNVFLLNNICIRICDDTSSAKS